MQGTPWSHEAVGRVPWLSAHEFVGRTHAFSNALVRKNVPDDSRTLRGVKVERSASNAQITGYASNLPRARAPIEPQRCLTNVGGRDEFAVR